MQPNSDGKASPGSPFKPPAARIWNNMVEAGKAYSDSRFDKSTPNPIRPRETDIIKAKNNSGAARRLGEILRISGKAIETVTDENKWLLGVEPTDDGYFGILKEPVAISGIASLQVSGCCMALVNVTNVDHKRATPADGDYVLQSGDDGPVEILYAPTGTGEKECVVRFAGGSGASSGGSTCPCVCISDGDILVNDIETTSRWSVAMSEEVFKQEFGNITLPAGTYTLIYDADDGVWVADIGDALTSAYLSGADATSATTMDGTLTMGFDAYGVPYVTLCVDGTVPEEP